MIHNTLNQVCFSYLRHAVGKAGLHTLHIFTHKKTCILYPQEHLCYPVLVLAVAVIM